MNGKIKHGIFGLRRVEFIFNLAALKSATAACRLDLGEFFSSKNLTEEHRIFYHSYGAWLKGRQHEKKLLLKYSKLYGKFNVIQISEIKKLRNAAEIVSAEYARALKDFAKLDEKKKP